MNEIKRIAKQNGIEHLSLASLPDSFSWATFTTSEDTYFEVLIDSSGTTELSENYAVYYTTSSCERRRGERDA